MKKGSVSMSKSVSRNKMGMAAARSQCSEEERMKNYQGGIGHNVQPSASR
jgi:hypothetical protein